MKTITVLSLLALGMVSAAHADTCANVTKQVAAYQQSLITQLNSDVAVFQNEEAQWSTQDSWWRTIDGQTATLHYNGGFANLEQDMANESSNLLDFINRQNAVWNNLIVDLVTCTPN